jgi:hypothetical protein
METWNSDIPVATAKLIQEPHQYPVHQGRTNAPPASLLRGTGRSSRVVLQEQDVSSFNPSRTSPKLSDQDIQSLKAQGFTMGLIRAMQYNAQIFPMRIWVVDNSGAWLKSHGFEHGLRILEGQVNMKLCLHSQRLLKTSHRKYEYGRWTSHRRESKCQGCQTGGVQSLE